MKGINSVKSFFQNVRIMFAIKPGRKVAKAIKQEAKSIPNSHNLASSTLGMLATKPGTLTKQEQKLAETCAKQLNTAYEEKAYRGVLKK
ncbi:MAG: hypothetical protein MJ231_01125 [bacterium]|nr:hypothetical protein [bacterium]